MYLDTKNLTVGSTSSASPIAYTETEKAKTTRRMRKVWQPLRRLLAVGGKGRPHPNNINLNNVTTELPHSLAVSSIDSKTIELPAKSLPCETAAELPPPPNTPTLISSVYVEKASSAPSCVACSHGRNCQHAHRTVHSSSSSAAASTPQPPTLFDLNVIEALNLPLQYVSTDNGTFFWANTQERVDDDLLHAWLCQSFSQLPGTLC